MIGKTILHYPPKADQPLAEEFIEKFGNGRPDRRLVHRSFDEGGNLTQQFRGYL